MFPYLNFYPYNNTILYKNNVISANICRALVYIYITYKFRVYICTSVTEYNMWKLKLNNPKIFEIPFALCTKT